MTAPDLAGLCERLRAISTTDHLRGCEGRNYHCTCLWDEMNMATGTKAAAAIESLVAVLDALLTEAEDVFVCMADATGIDRHNFPAPFIAARTALQGASDDR